MSRKQRATKLMSRKLRTTKLTSKSIKIKTYKKEELEYKIKKLKENGAMSSKNKDRIWESLLDFIGEELGLGGRSSFVLVDAGNENGEIRDADDLYKYWNEYWDKYLEDLMKMMRISPDEEYLKDKKGIVLKSSDDLKKMWDDEKECTFLLDVVATSKKKFEKIKDAVIEAVDNARQCVQLPKKEKRKLKNRA
ncbi:hypothetical protein RFI_16562 [Reticulomyxa filosa]|uniref:Uncharacterized protein n=1 Tax=Reticulomyxa filosa TaxID=46433 RepID=X6N4G5_RETFI|nr:hypothetical protein RFI_16562 [Reticulomyxa filosa]|eukprot:ETO20654.1 hypothetical protein RFI_16562 [Reticulomyxa filosa]